MPSQTATVLIPGDIGLAWGFQQALDLSTKFERRLKQPVVACSPDDGAAPLVTCIQKLIDAGHQRLIVMPVGLLPILARSSTQHTLNLAKQQWPQLQIHVAAPLTWQEWSGWLRTSALDALGGLNASAEETAVLVTGQSHANPLTNADIARLAHLIHEASNFADVRYSFLDKVRPDIPTALGSLRLQGISNVIVVPWLETGEQSRQQMEGDIEFARRVDNLNICLATPTLSHPAMINLLTSNHFATLTDDSSQNGPAAVVADQPANSTISDDDAFELRELQRRINAMLPSEYQGRYETVKPQSMGTASLKLDEQGRVAWGDIWTSFCDLALAGGPPHRGTLLEAVSAADALAEPEQYQAVVAEIERGIGLVTSLPVVPSKSPGWVGVRCESEEMAVWLMRAIIVENIMVRREGDVLYLPAGPKFTVKREIKNVITSVAKTVHYWSTHLLARRQSAE